MFCQKAIKTQNRPLSCALSCVSDLDLTLAIGSGGQFKITIKKTNKVNWKNQNYYDVTVELIDQEFNFEMWEMQIGNLYVKGEPPHKTNQLVTLINNVGAFTEDYGKFIAFKWGFSVKYRTAW